MSTFGDLAEIAKDGKKIVESIQQVRDEQKVALERDAEELEQVEKAAGRLAELYQNLPTRAQGQDAIDFLQASIDLINAQMRDPIIADDDLKMSSLLSKRGLLRSKLGLLQINQVFDTRDLFPASELSSIVTNLGGAQEAARQRVQAAEYTRIGFMVAGLVVKVGVAAAKAMV
jgi:hypothetical protein